MIAEMRALRTEYDNRRHFTPEKTPIDEARSLVAEWTAPAMPIDVEAVAARTAVNMRTAAEHDLFEVG